MRGATLLILSFSTLLWSCVPASPELAPATSAVTSLAAQGFSFAEEQCSGCHAVSRGESSLNPQAPTFDAVANDLDFTPATLREFFLDGHETPTQMSLRLEEEDAEKVTAYIMSLRKQR